MTREAGNLSRRQLGGLLGAGALTTLAPGAAAAAEEPFRPLGNGRPPRPNLLVILADDLGWADLSSYGAPEIRTPNLDRLAASGIRFTQSYSASSVCSPTRIGLYTGRYPGRLRGGLKEPIDAPNEVDGIPIGHPTLASLVKAAGYDTALIGKWHCGYLPWFSPTRLGWDEFFGNFSGGLDYFSKLSYLGAHDLFENEVEYHDLRYYTHIVTERATEFLGREHRKPWLLNLNYTTPHWPWESPGDQAVSDELTARIKAGEKGVLQHRDGGSLATYREMVEDLDRAIGQVLNALRRNGQLHNTLVFFASDNGGERFSNTWPFAGAKGQVAEGGLRVPTLLSWPGQLRPRQVEHAPVHTLDWTATFLELAGATPSPAHPLDGVSLAGHLFRGTPIPRRDLFWRMKGQRALRRGDLKYVRNGTTESLFDLGADVREQANLAKKRPADLAALRAAWEGIDATLVPYAT
ncbi:sulfatase-like hydrolase/transferase [Crossiella cryophila]|uniref:Arylsulfatase A-like enzyme n=1 Tax=Crossiella cryophila TaxID=43355 RepID=A0A7W7CBK5_9PSEU|nr:sulfatase-like hydrolase/transferase [Crossiella cryophila]MBB4678145.1 arylsulfatase A-like enzyme [Crossiella cryophila]